MDELISKKAAIDALHMHLMYRMGTDSNKKRLDDWINSLPSAQPKTNYSESPNTSDCISRQSAIDGLRDYLVGKRCPDDGTLTCRLIENEVINKLPTAEVGTDCISRQAATDALKAQADTMRTWVERYAEQRRGILTAVNIVEDIKPADVVPVVRCKDCIHNNDCDIQYSAQAGENFFCGFGETEKDVREDVYE